jgi:hypothetical protein
MERAALASRIHSFLLNACIRGASHAMRMHLAFLLSKVSNDIFRDFGKSIGLIGNPIPNWPTEQRTFQAVRNSDYGSHGSEDEKSRPDFVPVAVFSEIDRGARSLSLLCTTNPDHPLCHPDPSWSALCLGWCWTDDDVERRIASLERHVQNISKRIDDWRWNLAQARRSPDHDAGSIFINTTPFDDELHPSGHDSPADNGVTIPNFKIFDLEPGTQISDGSVDTSSAELNYAKFTHNFPAETPTAAPTLQTLLDVAVLQPLTTHARILSSSLLEVFLSDLDFIGHLDLLWRFVLFGDPSFAVRVRMALFTDSDDPDDAVKSQNRARDRRRSSANALELRRPCDNAFSSIHSGRGWGVGLNPSLSDVGIWPPAGSDLAFSLRRVIVDTLDDGRFETEDGERRTGHGRQRDEIWNQAEWRLGFIIRPFDEEDEEEGEPAWADPFCEYCCADALTCATRFMCLSSLSNPCFGFPRDGLQAPSFDRCPNYASNT